MSATTAARLLVNPFPGLRPFMHEEADLFFGRDRQSDELVRRLARKRFLAVLGTSGSGKSSLVRAGLLPSLEGGLMAEAGTHWLTAILRPQDDPIGFLARALVEAGVLSHLDLSSNAAEAVVETTLRRSSLGLVEVVRLARLEPHQNLLVLVDQFEELFRFADLATQHGTEDEAKAFVKLLLAAAQQTEVPVYVVITMRSDFLGDCDRFAGLPEAIADSPYLTPRMTRDELQAAITGPVGVRGGRIAAGLVQRLLNDVGDDPDQLPILQHALMRAWDHWQQDEPKARSIDVSDLEAIGGMAEALSRHAEEAYASLVSDRERMIAEQLFKCLTEKGPDNRELRRPTPLSRIAAIASADPAEVVGVIDVFRAPGRSFLMPPHGVELDEDSVVDISHESLIRQWWRLDTWASEEAQSARTYYRLAEIATLHAAGEANLWRDPDLQLALNWRDQTQPNETWASRYHPGFETAMRFLTLSQEEREAARRAARRRIVRLISVCLGSIVVLAVVAAYAWVEQSNANKTAREASANALASAADNQLANHRDDLALLLSLAAYREKQTRQAASSVEKALRAARQIHATVLRGSRGGVTALAASSQDGKTLAVGDSDGTVLVWDLPKRILRQTLKSGNDAVTTLSLSPNGDTLAAAYADGRVEFWNMERHTSRFLHVSKGLHVSAGAVGMLSFSGNGHALASADSDRWVKIWNTRNGKPMGNPLPGDAMALNSDASHLVILSHNSGDVEIWKWDKKTRDWQHTYNVGQGARASAKAKKAFAQQFAQKEITAVALNSPTLAVGYHDDNGWTVQLWDLNSYGTTTQGKLERFRGKAVKLDTPVNNLAFSPDGATLAVAGNDGSLRLFDVRSLALTPRSLPLDGNQGPVSSVVFNEHSGKTTVVAGYHDGNVLLWPLQAQTYGVISDAFTKRTTAVGVSSDSGKKLVFATTKGTVLVVDRRTNGRGRILATRQGTISDMALSPDERTLAFGRADGDVQLWSLRPPGKLPPLSGSGPVSNVFFTPDGNRLLTIYRGKLQLWDWKKRKRIGRSILTHQGGVLWVAFDAPGRRMAVVGIDGTIRLKDVNGAFGQRIYEKGATIAAFSPDGSMLAIGGSQGTVRLWDIKRARSRYLPGNQRDVTAVAFSRNGDWVASSGSDGTVALSNLDDNTRQLLDLNQGKALSVWFSEDGKTLAAVTDEGIATWTTDDLALDAKTSATSVSTLETQICSHVVGDLTEAEWKASAPDLEYRKTCGS